MDAGPNASTNESTGGHDRLEVPERGNLASAVTVAISPGELLDKISILQIKSQRISDPEKLRNVQAELEMLTAARDRSIPASANLGELSTDLRQVNELLWDVEDSIRACERNSDFGPKFIALARSVYTSNDVRAAIKRQINEQLGSRLIEEKSYDRPSGA